VITRNSLPAGYTAYSDLTICSNRLIGGGHLLAIGEALPLVVGSGTEPMVWLQSTLLPVPGGEFGLVVDGSIPRVPGISVSAGPNGLTFVAGGMTLLRIKQLTPQSAVVDMLDLRPLGLNVFGDSNGLNAGTSTFSRNSISGPGAMIALGKPSLHT
jgi:hypothetical protein